LQLKELLLVGIPLKYFLMESLLQVANWSKPSVFPCCQSSHTVWNWMCYQKN
jgi:hypothetical protein